MLSSEPPATTTNMQESQYLSLIKTIMASGSTKSDRTQTGTTSLFAPQPLKFSLLNNTFPLLTTKRVPARHVFEELMWFIRGQTDASILQSKGITIWDGNASRSFLDSVGLVNNPTGDLGPVYGFQWRHFGALYKGVEGSVCDGEVINYFGQGVDQLKEVIGKIRDEPWDRRILLSAWNPADLKKMALPPCHLLCQFYVSENQDTKQPRLSCQLYQRSADVGLGVPFNIASYSLLLHMLARVTGCEPYEFTHVLGDAHIYSNHYEALNEQITRVPMAFPKLLFKSGCGWREQREKGVDEMVKELEGFEWEDMEVVGYKPGKKLVMKMAV